ncbi:MAG: hypothetical protein HKP11_04105, partial [Flavobacteriaceae bacterium]|nr:hypothetical protein [Flavobacteriaceae bacterium]
RGEAVASISGDSTQLRSSEEKVVDMNMSQTFRFVDKKLESKPGLHRFLWDLRQKGAWSKEEKRRYKNGPIVAPGKYSVKLMIAENTLEQSFDLLMDPRVIAQGITKNDIQKQLTLQNKVIDLLSEARKLQADLEDESKELKGKKAKVKKERLAKVDAVLEQLKNAEGAYPQQMLVSQIGYLLNMISGADQLPGKDAEQRFTDLLSEFQGIKEKLRMP